jgi:hypothetical protein
MEFDRENSPFEHLWSEYGEAFKEYDDTSLARWMCQTLGQIEGKAWRMSHPLLGAYRLCASLADKRQVWLKRLATPPASYPEAPCCRAPMLPLLTRDVVETGLSCPHCTETVVAFEEIPEPLRTRLSRWAETYAKVHAVAHWDEQQRASSADYDDQLEAAAKKAEALLADAGQRLAPMLLEHYAAVIWEDHDECLEVRPEDIRLG